MRGLTDHTGLLDKDFKANQMCIETHCLTKTDINNYTNKTHTRLDAVSTV